MKYLSIFCVVFFFLTLTTKLKSCHEIGNVYNYVLDSTVEIYSARNLQNSSLPSIKNSTRVEFSLQPIKKTSSDLLITKLKVGLQLETTHCFKLLNWNRIIDMRTILVGENFSWGRSDTKQPSSLIESGWVYWGWLPSTVRDYG